MKIENQNTEFKSVWKDEYLKWICAFANARGGTLLVGVNDEGDIVGINNYKKLLDDLPNKIRDILGVIVEINHKTENYQNFLEINVDAYSTPISYKGHFYYRSGSTIQDLNGPSLEKFLLDKKVKNGIAQLPRVLQSMIYNNGKLPEGWTIKTLKQKHTSEPANPDIAKIFFRAGYIEVWGRGIKNIMTHCTNANLPEPFYKDMGTGYALIF